MEKTNLQRSIERTINNNREIFGNNDNLRVRSVLYEEDDLDLQIELGLVVCGVSEKLGARLDQMLDIIYIAQLRRDWHYEKDFNTDLKGNFKEPSEILPITKKMRKNKELPEKYKIPRRYFGFDEDSNIVSSPPAKILRKYVQK